MNIRDIATVIFWSFLQCEKELEPTPTPHTNAQPPPLLQVYRKIPKGDELRGIIQSTTDISKYFSGPRNLTGDTGSFANV